MMSLAEISRRNVVYWAEQSRLRDIRLSDPALAAAALEMLRDEERRDVPIRSRLILEACLERTDAQRQQSVDHARPEIESEATRKAISANGRKGGSAPKTRDPLQSLIHQVVRENPRVTEGELKRKLEFLSGPGSLFDTDDDTIHYELPGGRSKRVRLSTLKDRLSRAKKAYRASR